MRRSRKTRLVKSNTWGNIKINASENTYAVATHRAFIEPSVQKQGTNHPLTTLKRDTSLTQRISVVEYPTGDVEVTAIRLDAETRLGCKGSKKRVNREKSEMSETVLRKSQNRSKKIVRKKCLTMQADRMLTLTFKENLTDISDAWKVLKYFNKLMRWRYKEDYQYIAVPEYQKRGAVHFHLAIKGFYHANTVRLLWHRAVGDLGGNIDITSPRKYNFNSWNPKRISQYLSKYITKNETVEFNAKRYSSSANLVLPEKRIEWLAMGVPVISVMVDIVKSITHMPILTVWENDKYYSISYMST